MLENQEGGGKFIEVILNPVITIEHTDMIDLALSLHEKAHACCFIANSVNFPVKHNPILNIQHIV
jgi:organic hydroperoxide reductase OsmC/OhrA